MFWRVKEWLKKHSKCEDDLTVKEIKILEPPGVFPIMESENIIYLKKKYSFGEGSLWGIHLKMNIQGIQYYWLTQKGIQDSKFSLYWFTNPIWNQNHDWKFLL